MVSNPDRAATRGASTAIARADRGQRLAPDEDMNPPLCRPRRLQLRRQRPAARSCPKRRALSCPACSRVSPVRSAQRRSRIASSSGGNGSPRLRRVFSISAGSRSVPALRSMSCHRRSRTAPRRIPCPRQPLDEVTEREDRGPTRPGASGPSSSWSSVTRLDVERVSTWW